MDLTLEIRNNVWSALSEDIGSGDLSANLVPAGQPAKAHIFTREPAVLCGVSWAEACFRHLDSEAKINWLVKEGGTISEGQQFCELQGDARALLTAERVALNFLQTLSATATLTRRYVDAIWGTGAVIMDTRKTIPGLRLAQKYAVKVGGGENQRFGLYDDVLIKENHIAAAGGVKQALRAARSSVASEISVQIEVETLTELADALDAGATLILLDNFDLATLREAVSLNAHRARLEASGGVTLENIRTIAETGVDRISIGALTKNVCAIDMSMRFL